MSYRELEQIKAGAGIREAQIRAGASVDAAQIAADASTSNAVTSADASKYGAESYAGALRYGADRRLQGERYGADQRLEGIKYENPLVELPLDILDFGFDKRAEGGSVTKGKPYIVGEKGPEVMVPEQSGTVIPNQNSGAAPPIQVIKGMNVSSVGGGQPAPPQGGTRRTIKVPLRVYEGIMRARAEMMRASGEGGTVALNRDIIRQKQNLDAFTNRIQSDPRFYKETAEGMVPVTPGLGQIVLGHRTLGMADPEGAFKSFEPQALRHIDESKYVNEQGIGTAVSNMTKAGYTLTPGQKAWLTTEQGDTAAEKKRRDTILQWAKPASVPQGNPQPVPGGGEAANPVSLTQPEPLAQPPASYRSRRIDLQSLQGNNPTNPSPPISVSALAFRPDQVGKLSEGFQSQLAQKKKLSALSQDIEGRLGR